MTILYINGNVCQTVFFVGNYNLNEITLYTAGRKHATDGLFAEFKVFCCQFSAYNGNNYALDRTTSLYRYSAFYPMATGHVLFQSISALYKRK